MRFIRPLPAAGVRAPGAADRGRTLARPRPGQAGRAPMARVAGVGRGRAHRHRHLAAGRDGACPRGRRRRPPRVPRRARSRDDAGLGHDPGAGASRAASGRPCDAAPQDPQAASLYGASVAVSGDTALVGAPGNPGDTEAVYVFVKQPAGWVQQAKLAASDGTDSDSFGAAVALDGDTAVIGAQTAGGFLGSFGPAPPPCSSARAQPGPSRSSSPTRSAGAMSPSAARSESRAASPWWARPARGKLARSSSTSARGPPGRSRTPSPAPTGCWSPRSAGR
jgi:hypothetical protein